MGGCTIFFPAGAVGMVLFDMVVYFGSGNLFRGFMRPELAVERSLTEGTKSSKERGCLYF